MHARDYHELTSYKPGQPWPTPSIDHPDYVPDDEARWPASYKLYDAPRIALPREWPRDETPATRILAHGAPPMALDLPALARTLYLSGGIVRVVERPNRRTVLLRAAGSAGGRFPLELYVSAKGIDGLDDGVYWYDPA